MVNRKLAISNMEVILSQAHKDESLSPKKKKKRRPFREKFNMNPLVAQKIIEQLKTSSENPRKTKALKTHSAQRNRRREEEASVAGTKFFNIFTISPKENQ